MTSMGNEQPTHTLRDLSIDFVSLVPQGADPDAHIMLAKAHTPEPTNPAAPTRGLPTSKETPVANELNENVAKALGEDHGFELTDEQIAGLNALTSEPVADPETTNDPTPTPEATGEALAADTATADAAITKAVEPIQKLLNETREELAKERETRGIADAVTQARKDFSDLSVDPDEIGPAIYRLGKGTGTEADMTLFKTTLAAASAQGAIAKISEPIGFDGEAPDGTAAATVEGLAKDIQTADPTVGTLAARVAAAKSPQGRAAYDAAAAE